MSLRGLLCAAAVALMVVGSGCAVEPQATAPAAQALPAVPLLPAASPALPQAGDLTLAQNAGSVLLGLSLRPAAPGPNTLVVYVLPLEGPAAAADVPLRLVVNGQPVALDTCSRTCRTATVNLQGGEHLDAIVDGPIGGTASFDLPALPAPDGTALLQQLQARMHRLRSYRVDETLGPAQPPLQASYAFEAPDRMRLDLASGASTIWIGPTRYQRAAASDTWQREAIGSSVPVPSFAWDLPAGASGYLGTHLVGAETVDGVATQVLAFFWSAGQNVAWFRLSVDDAGLVRHASMRAPGHFMEDHNTDFDAPLAIEPPD